MIGRPMSPRATDPLFYAPTVARPDDSGAMVPLLLPSGGAQHMPPLGAGLGLLDRSDPSTWKK